MKEVCKGNFESLFNILLSTYVKFLYTVLFPCSVNGHYKQLLSLGHLS